MKPMRVTTGKILLDRRTNEDILKKNLMQTQLEIKLAQYK
jgi:hypothetical protein